MEDSGTFNRLQTKSQWIQVDGSRLLQWSWTLSEVRVATQVQHLDNQNHTKEKEAAHVEEQLLLSTASALIQDVMYSHGTPTASKSNKVPEYYLTVVWW